MQEMLQAVLQEIKTLRQKKPDKNLLIAIDGRCAAGKTTLGAALQEILGGTVIHMDHFFLRPSQRSGTRLREPGGNVDYERFIQEVLGPLKKGDRFSYCPFDCKMQKMEEAIEIEAFPYQIIEGSYSCHPLLRDSYDLRIFLTVEEKEQMRRIRDRNGADGAVLFQEKWIPLEEHYFLACAVREACEMCFSTGP